MNNFALLVPCYNAENYVLQFLTSIEALTKSFDEVIFYDDASTDNTVSILRKNGQIVIEGKVNKGPAFARNQLASETKCNWFHFHDIDDFLAADYLEKVSKEAEKECYDVILCNVDWLSEKKDQLVLAWHYSNSRIQEDPILYTLRNPIGGINGLYNRTAFEQINGFDESLQMWEDSDLHVRLAIRGARFYVLEEVLSFSIRYSSSQSTDQKKSWQYRLVCLDNYKKLLVKKPIYLRAIGLLSERLAGTFISHGNLQFAKRAIALSQECGINIPTTNSFIWRIIRNVLPANLVVKLRILHLTIAFGKA